MGTDTARLNNTPPIRSTLVTDEDIDAMISRGFTYRASAFGWSEFVKVVDNINHMRVAHVVGGWRPRHVVLSDHAGGCAWYLPEGMYFPTALAALAYAEVENWGQQ